MFAVAALPPDELSRLAALRRYRVLDTDAEPGFDRITTLVTRSLDVPISLVSLLDERREWFKACSGFVVRETPREIAFGSHTILGDGVMVVPDTLADSRFAHHPLVIGAPHVRAFAGAPLRTASGHGVGTVCAIDTRPRQFTADELDTLTQLAAIVIDELELRIARVDLDEQQQRTEAHILALLAVREELAHLATTDELTSIANHRAFRQRLDLLIADANRGRRFALVLVDVDHFKRFNDEHGHQAGDRVLTSVATTLAGRVRRTDLAARYGGEEFAVLLADVDGATAAHVADQLRSAIETMAASDSPHRVTASFGVAAFTAAMDATSLIAAADTALYAAKHAGRNRVVAA